jgi:ATP-dependent RNA helicase DDX24/MAK5
VIHYDIARSPQLYIHRSGRTARANTKGTAVSLVAPEDAYHHNEICQTLSTAGVKEIIIPTGIDKCPKLPNLAVDIKIMPTLTERIKLAKKIFTQSFVVSKRSKEQSWLRQSADEADLEMVKHVYVYDFFFLII